MTKGTQEYRECMIHADMELAASGITQRAVKAGARAPDFRLPDARGVHVRLHDPLAKDQDVVSFYRSACLPSCILEPRALQNSRSEVRPLGAQLLSISPQT